MRLIRLFILALAAGLLSIAALAQEPETETGEGTTIANETVLLAGATGRTGRLIAAQLKRQGYTVRAMVRSIERGEDVLGDGYEFIVADVRDPDSMQVAFDGVDRVISAIGATQPEGDNSPEMVDYGGVKNLTDLSKEFGVKQFVLLSSGGVTDDNHPLNNLFGNVLRWKFKGENYVRNSDMPYTIIRPGGLRDTDGGEKGILLLQGDFVADGLISRSDVASVTLAALANEDAFNKTFEIFNYDAVDLNGWRGSFARLTPDMPVGE